MPSLMRDVSGRPTAMQASSEPRSLSVSDARELTELGFTVIDGPCSAERLERISVAYDHTIATANASDRRFGSSTRVWDIVSRGPEFDELYIFPPLLQACSVVIGPEFKLSATCFRTLEPGAPSQSLHVDVIFQAPDWPVLGFILMVDAFEPQNGATRFVPYSHLRTHGPDHPEAEANLNRASEVFACGPAGSLIIFNGSVWHGHPSNRSERRRRSIQGHFIPRHAKAALDYEARLSTDDRARINSVGKYVLGLASAG